jgi:hypothetical protein
MAWDELKPGIRQATERYVLDYIGTALYNDLAGKYQAGDALSQNQQAFLELLQDTIANYTIYHILPERRSVLSSLGVVEQSPQGGSNAATYPIYKEKRRGALDNADAFLDRALSFLENTGDAYFDLWKNSTAAKLKVSDFFKLTSELDEYVNIQQSRRSFISIVRFCKQVEEDHILPKLCSELYDQLLVASPSAANVKLIPMVRKAVAYLGAAAAIPHHRIVIDGDGFRVVSQTDSWDDRRNLTNNVHESAVNALLVRCEQQGKAALAKLIAFLEDNLNDYPTYRDSTCRIVSASKEHSIRQSDNMMGAVGLF